MNISPNDEKIQKYLDELSEEYKDLLFKALLERSKSIDDISISELLRIDNEIKKPLQFGYQNQQRRRKLFIIGIIYVFIGFFIYSCVSIIGVNFISNISNIALLVSVVISLVGLGSMVVAFVLPMTKNERKHLEQTNNEINNLLSYRVISQWRELEGIVYDLAESENIFAPRSIIEYLLNNDLIDKYESNTLKDFLRIRNSITHSSNENYSSNEINEVLEKVSIIISKLKKIL